MIDCPDVLVVDLWVAVKDIVFLDYWYIFNFLSGTSVLQEIHSGCCGRDLCPSRWIEGCRGEAKNQEEGQETSRSHELQVMWATLSIWHWDPPFIKNFLVLSVLKSLKLFASWVILKNIPIILIYGHFLWLERKTENRSRALAFTC